MRTDDERYFYLPQRPISHPTNGSHNVYYVKLTVNHKWHNKKVSANLTLMA